MSPKRKKVAAKPKRTIQSEWFPETNPALEAMPTPWKVPGETVLDTELRLFCRAARWAYNGLREGRTREELKVAGQQLHGLNSRYIDEAVQWATEMLSSQKERLPGQIADLEQKIGRTEKKRSRAERQKQALGGYDARLAKLRKEYEELVAHRDAGTIPPAIFGGRKAFDERCKGKISQAEWRARRRNRLICRGDRTKKGNPHLRIHADEKGRFRLEVALSHLVDKGKDAPRLRGRLFVPPKYREDLRWALLDESPYTVELLRGTDGRYRAHITIEVDVAPLTVHVGPKALGIDLNPDRTSLVETDASGNALSRRTILHPELEHARRNKREVRIGEIAVAIVEWAHVCMAGLVLENLCFTQGRLDTDKRFNRMASQFVYRRLHAAILRQALERGVEVVLVPAAYSSAEGVLKYARDRGMSDHEAASYVLARRGLAKKDHGRMPRERVTAGVRARIEALVADLTKYRKELGTKQQDGKPGDRDKQVLLNRIRTVGRWIGRLAKWQQFNHGGRAWFMGVISEMRRRRWSRVFLLGGSNGSNNAVKEQGVLRTAGAGKRYPNRTGAVRRAIFERNRRGCTAPDQDLSQMKTGRSEDDWIDPSGLEARPEGPDESTARSLNLVWSRRDQARFFRVNPGGTGPSRGGS
ncbi:MAG: IS200/IS605 family element transposase accessory protein TnpB [Candidatus Schekmanbacteria bacterium]|nr:IS200/IS605 family element transposase accessory protein TnpB [Candidatus Schekmanbacteria bacterium]